MTWLQLWRNRELAGRLVKWFVEIVRHARDAVDAARRLSESIEQGDLDDIVKRTQAVAQRRKDYVDNG